jgi:hypothetical protein
MQKRLNLAILGYISPAEHPLHSPAFVRPMERLGSLLVVGLVEVLEHLRWLVESLPLMDEMCKREQIYQKNVMSTANLHNVGMVIGWVN